MPLLNTATKVYVGSTPALKVYRGSTLVWTPPVTASYGPTQYSYDATDVPPGSAITTAHGAAGNDVTFAVAGRIIGMRYWYSVGHAATSITLRVWSATGPTLLGSVVIGNDPGGAWSNPVMFATPISVTAGQVVRPIGEFTSGDQLPRTVTNSGVSAVRGDMTRHGQFYTGTTGTYPTSLFTTRWYMTDILFQKLL